MRVATLNLLQDLHRWPERLPLVVDALAGVAADVVALQEVALPIGQDHLLASMLTDAGLPYAVHTAPKWGDQNAEAVSVLTLAPARDHAVLELPGDGGRVAQRVHVRTASGGGNDDDMVVVNTHLNHQPYDDESVRLPQAEAILAWLAADGLLPRSVLLGDLNASPGSSTLVALRSVLTSLLPDGTATFPTPLVDADLAPVQIDHALVGPGLTGTARLLADRPHPEDPDLWPSDHLGVVADVHWR